MLDDKALYFSTQHFLMLHVCLFSSCNLLRFPLHGSESNDDTLCMSQYLAIETQNRCTNFMPTSQADAAENLDVYLCSSNCHMLRPGKHDIGGEGEVCAV